MGAMMLMPPLKAWLPLSHDRLSMNSNCSVCWNFGRKSGEPMRPIAVDGDARETAGHHGIRDHARDPRGRRRLDPVGLMQGVGVGLRP
jgi:hypothetical protein